MTADAAANLLALSFRPSFPVLASTRGFLYELFGHLWPDEDLAFRLVTTLHELLENVIKYSVDGVAHVSGELMPADDGAASVICLRVSNQCEPRRLAELREHFDVMKKNSADPITYYTDLMVANAKRKLASGIGLARIWAEAEMEIDCDITGSTATIVARTGAPSTTNTQAPRRS
jgi:hypothetical protein